MTLANQCEHSFHKDVPDLLYIEIFMLFSTQNKKLTLITKKKESGFGPPPPFGKSNTVKLPKIGLAPF